MQEIWKPVIGYEGLYEVSNLGKVQSISRQGTQGKVLFVYPHPKSGYLITNISKNGIRKIKKIHHLVLEAFIGPCPKGMECRHLNGNKTDNYFKNLAWGTRQENVYDKILHKTVKLTTKQIKEIKNATGSYGFLKEIALKYGVCRGTVYRIRNGKYWQHV